MYPHPLYPTDLNTMPFEFITPSGKEHTLYTSSHANAPQSIAHAMHRRAVSGMGIIATPNYPYNPHSVWNRNQLGALDLSNPMTLIGVGVAIWLLYGALKKR